ncbi:hypothetical protein BROOK1789C_1898 [Bathymodiolus brooksi thiotrophic gill symbiont]|nr:hypothetical protein BROOK1789C_1898 [Bathymodiolus brooksi thiotrophic gill symbiont]
MNPSRLTYLIKLIKLFLLAHLFCTALYFKGALSAKIVNFCYP